MYHDHVCSFVHVRAKPRARAAVRADCLPEAGVVRVEGEPARVPRDAATARRATVCGVGHVAAGEAGAVDGAEVRSLRGRGDLVTAGCVCVDQLTSLLCVGPRDQA